MTVEILHGDCNETLKTLPDASVNCCVTSPPYYGLRAYQGGSAEIGIEKTPDEYITNLVALFHEVKRVLRDDGTLWVNIGDSYGNKNKAYDDAPSNKNGYFENQRLSTVTNIADFLNYGLKGCQVIFLDSLSIAVSSHSVDVPLYNKRPPQSVLGCLFGTQGEAIEYRDDDFSKVFDFLAAPRYGGSSFPDSRSGMIEHSSAADPVVYEIDCGGIIFTNLDSDLKSEFGVLRSSSTRTSKSNNTTFTVKESGKPRAKVVIRRHSIWDTFSLAAQSKGIPDVNLMDQPIALRNGLLAFACLCSDLVVTHASEQQVTFRSICGSLIFTISDVRHLRFSFQGGRVVPYSELYANAIKRANVNKPKQELGIPDLLKRALMEDGWICRQTIIWHKPNPMPESVKDRCTKAHEYIFLFSKKPKYYFDSDVISEDAIYQEVRNGRIGAYQIKAMTHKGDGTMPTGIADRDLTKRNKRSVWTVNTKPYKGAHFAAFPGELIEPCILAGCPEGGTVLDPFAGSGTVGGVANKHLRKAILCELNEDYCKLIPDRVNSLTNHVKQSILSTQSTKQDITVLDTEKVVSVFIKMRDRKAEITKRYEAEIAELDAKQAVLQNALLDFCKENKIESIKTSFGTAFRTIKTRLFVSDWQAVEKFIYDNDAFDLLEKRLAQNAAKTWTEENPDKPIPSLVTDSKYCVTIRRGKL